MCSEDETEHSVMLLHEDEQFLLNLRMPFVSVSDYPEHGGRTVAAAAETELLAPIVHHTRITKQTKVNDSAQQHDLNLTWET